MLWQMYYDMYWDFHPHGTDAAAHVWADHLLKYNRTPGHYDLSVHHRGD
jgi:hypothetical protein